MIPLFRSNNYQLILDDVEKELEILNRGGKLESSLLDWYNHGPIEGKTLALELSKNTFDEGVEIVFSPRDYTAWTNITEIIVRIDRRAYNRLIRSRKFSGRYSRFGKVEIVESRD